jgi:hypothetical protein
LAERVVEQQQGGRGEQHGHRPPAARRDESLEPEHEQVRQRSRRTVAAIQVGDGRDADDHHDQRAERGVGGERPQRGVHESRA